MEMKQIYHNADGLYQSPSCEVLIYETEILCTSTDYIYGSAGQFDDDEIYDNGAY